MDILDKETKFLIKLTEDLYKKSLLPNVKISEINVDKFIDVASKNNFLYYVVRKIAEKFSLPLDFKSKFTGLISHLEPKILEIKESITEINKNIQDGMIFKTFRGYERIPNDIDVLVKDFDLAMDSFLQSGYSQENYIRKERSVGLLRPERMKIHLQNQVSWAWANFMDEDFIYTNPRRVMFHGQEILIPNINADFLIHLAHINFEPLHITFSELLYIFNLSRKIDFDIVLKEAKKYYWNRTLIRTLNLINNFHNILYGDLCFKELTFHKMKIKKIVFPYCFSRKHIILAAMEKRLFIYPLTKLVKVIKVLLSGDSYSGYYTPPEGKK